MFKAREKNQNQFVWRKALYKAQQREVTDGQVSVYSKTNLVTKGLHEMRMKGIRKHFCADLLDLNTLCFTA